MNETHRDTREPAPSPRNRRRASAARLASALALGATALLLLLPPPVDGQSQRSPAIRISGGHVWIGDRHAGSIGAGRDAFGLSRLIRDGLRRTGDARSARFGPGRVSSGWFPPRQHGRAGPIRGHWIPTRFPPGQKGRHLLHADPGLIFILHHPLGGLVFVGRTTFVRAAYVGGGAAGWSDAEPGGAWNGETDTPSRTGRREPPAAAASPLGPESPYCADVRVGFGAGGAYELRIDLRTVDASTPEEAEAALVERSRRGRPLVLRDVYGVGFNVPASLVDEVRVGACRSPVAPPR